MIAISDHSDHLLIGIFSFLSGGGLLRFGVYVSNALPPLPATAGFWTQLFYNCVKGLSGVDPNTIDPTKKPVLVAAEAKQNP